jgi:hypothetical protein
MFRWATQRTAVAVMAATMLFGLSGSASAGEYDVTFQKVVTWKTVTTYETRDVLYQKAVTRYDHCGNPYTAYVPCTRTVTVSVTTTVPVVTYVKVCD